MAGPIPMAPPAPMKIGKSDNAAEPAEAGKPVTPPSPGDGSISIRPWDPSTPYSTELKGAKPENYLKVYMEQRKQGQRFPGILPRLREISSSSRNRTNSRLSALQHSGTGT